MCFSGPDKMIKVLSDAKCTPESLVLSLPFLSQLDISVRILITFISGILNYTLISSCQQEYMYLIRVTPSTECYMVPN